MQRLLRGATFLAVLASAVCIAGSVYSGWRWYAESQHFERNIGRASSDPMTDALDSTTRFVLGALASGAIIALLGILRNARSQDSDTTRPRR